MPSHLETITLPLHEIDLSFGVMRYRLTASSCFMLEHVAEFLILPDGMILRGMSQLFQRWEYVLNFSDRKFTIWLSAAAAFMRLLSSFTLK